MSSPSAAPIHDLPQPDSTLDSAEQLWPLVLDRLREQISDPAFEIWLRPLKPLCMVDGRLVISAPPALRAWSNERYGGAIRTEAARVLGQEVEVVLIDGHESRRGAPGSKVSSDQRGPGLRPSGLEATLRSLNPRYRFDQFIIGESNHLAHAAALAVAEVPFQTYNPLFIFGPTGVGKTHLLQAIGNHALTFTPNLSIAYTTVESFTNEFVQSLRGGNMSRFKDRYRKTDFLMVDDVHFLEGKEQTQEEFFHTFNALYEVGSQIVLSSDRSPSELSLLHSRLKSRFELGLSVDVEEPDYNTRLAILQKRAEADKVLLHDPALLNHIASRITGNVRALEGALIRTVAYSSLTQKPVTVELAEQVISKLHGTQAANPIKSSVETIMDTVCGELGVSRDDLRSASRTSSITYPRHLAMYLARELTDLSLPKLARAFNRSDHTTILNASNKIARLSVTDPKTRSTITRLRKSLSENTRRR